MFHEFGHALHGLFANQTYPLVSGTNVARDYVEFPSQFNENWALYPDVLKHYAVNYKTGATIPQSLVDKIKASENWGQGYALGELLAGAAEPGGCDEYAGGGVFRAFCYLAITRARLLSLSEPQSRTSGPPESASALSEKLLARARQ